MDLGTSVLLFKTQTKPVWATVSSISKECVDLIFGKL